jgi:hypothetical protein
MDATAATVRTDASKRRLTVFLDRDVIQYLRRAAAAMPGRPSVSVVVSDLVRSARATVVADGGQ